MFEIMIICFIMYGIISIISVISKPEKKPKICHQARSFEDSLLWVWQGLIFLRFIYQKDDGQREKRDVKLEKIGISEYGDIYFAGHCLKREEHRLFAARKIQGDIILEGTGEVVCPHSFIMDILDEYFKQAQLTQADRLPRSRKAEKLIAQAANFSCARKYLRLSQTQTFSIADLQADFTNKISVRDSIFRENGLYFANVFKNIDKNFVNLSPEVFAASVQILESKSKMARLIRRLSENIFSGEMLPTFLYTCDYDKNTEILNGIRENIPVKPAFFTRSNIENMLLIQEERKTYLPETREIPDTSFLQMAQSPELVFEKNVRPWLEIVCDRPLSPTIQHKHSARLIKLQDNNGQGLLTIGFGKYKLTQITFANKDKVQIHPFGLMGRETVQRIRQTLLQEKIRADASKKVYKES